MASFSREAGRQASISILAARGSASIATAKGRGANTSTLDDGISQEAIRFLSRLDKALGFKDEKVHEAARTSPSMPCSQAQFPMRRISAGLDRPRRQAAGDQGELSRLRVADGGKDQKLLGHVHAERWPGGYGCARRCSKRTRSMASRELPKALERLGDFLILAQMPDPQPAWAQQYNYAMQPIWARRFEPAAITGGESQDVLETLMTIYRVPPATRSTWSRFRAHWPI